MSPSPPIAKSNLRHWPNVYYGLIIFDFKTIYVVICLRVCIC